MCVFWFLVFGGFFDWFFFFFFFLLVCLFWGGGGVVRKIELIRHSFDLDRPISTGTVEFPGSVFAET